MSHKEARSLFGALIDDELPKREALRLRSHLDACVDCRSGWERYERAVRIVRGVEREKPHPALATLILRRVRRRRIHGARALHLSHVHNRVPVEAIIPVMLGIAVAAVLILMAPQ
ncbi:MAG: zf-HC2 domain-containing protein [Myxococcaceae bacterium]|nr:zf-HC2 domain-containing protein [Myxococcaceae bacterium]